MDYREIAEWMVDELDTKQQLEQADVVLILSSRFGPNAVYPTKGGAYAINQRILANFRKMTGKNVIWERGSRCWRFRQPSDKPGRGQV